jgi:hypothetical protein
VVAFHNETLVSNDVSRRNACQITGLDGGS